MKHLFLVFTMAFSLLSCNSSQKKEEKNEKLSLETVNNQEKEGSAGQELTDIDLEAPFSEKVSYFFSKEDFPITIDAISKQEFLSAQKKAMIAADKPRKITDIKAVVPLLKGLAEFNTDESKDDFGTIKKVHFRNGVKDEFSEKWQEYWFKAYFPDEDILLCEGGHSTDLLLNLASGKEEGEIGNPDYITNSPAKTIRLNGYYTGQSDTYFIEKKKDDKYQKIIELDKVIYAYNGLWCEYIKEAFWADERTLFLSFEGCLENTNQNIYNKITIKEKEIIKENIIKTFPLKDFPIEEVINKQNIKYPLLDKALAAKLFSGLFPDAVNIYACYALAYSDDFSTIVIAVEKSYQESITTYLFTISKEYEIIDNLLLSHQAVNANDSSFLLSKNEIVKKEKIYFTDEYSAEYIHYKIDEKGNIILTQKQLIK